MHAIFTWNAHHKHQVIGVFKTGYILIILALVLMAYFLAHDQYIVGMYVLGINAGQVALLLFCTTLIPGILRRFSIRGSFVSLLMLYRRHLGITTFAFTFFHYAAIRLFPMLFAGDPFILIPPLFEAFGVVSLFTMSILFFTSNHWSVRTFGKWWSRIHMLIYATAWGVFFHVFLQEVSLWTILIGFFAVGETISLIYSYTRKHHKI